MKKTVDSKMSLRITIFSDSQKVKKMTYLECIYVKRNCCLFEARHATLLRRSLTFQEFLFRDPQRPLLSFLDPSVIFYSREES